MSVLSAGTSTISSRPAPSIEETECDVTLESVCYPYMRLSAPADITGVPSLTVPVGRDSAAMPIGMRPMGRPLGEATLLRVAHAYKQAGVRTT